MNPDAKVEIRDTEHLFYRLDLFQKALEEHAANNHDTWKPNVRAMTKQWLDMGLRPRAVTRDLEWGINVPLEGMNGMENASMYGLKRFKDTLHAHKYGRIHTQTNPLGKIGGLRMMRKINVITTF